MAVSHKWEIEGFAIFCIVAYTDENAQAVGLDNTVGIKEMSFAEYNYLQKWLKGLPSGNSIEIGRGKLI